MNRHPNDETLLQVALGEASAEARDHVTACPECGLRENRMMRELETIAIALRQPPPRPVPASARARWRLPRLVPVLAASLAIAALVSGWLLRPTAPLVVAKAASSRPASDLSTSFAEVGAAVFGSAGEATVPGIVGTSSIRAATMRLSDVERALAAGRPCTSARLFDGACNDYTNALYF